MDGFEGIKPMDVGELVKAIIKGVGQDHFEIRPGLSNMMKFMSRLAPQFMLNQTAIEQRNKC